MSLFTDLQNAGLPVVSATDGAQASFSRALDDAELEIYLNLLFPNRHIQLARKANAINGAILAEQFKAATAQQAVDMWCSKSRTGPRKRRRWLRLIMRLRLRR